MPLALAYQRARLTSSLVGELLPLLEAHAAEIAHYKDIVLNVDWERYEVLQQAGVLQLFTARRTDDNILVGYAAFVKMYNPHFKDSLQANQDVIYVDPSARGLGASFIAFCDRELQRDGVQVVYQHTKVAHDFGKLLLRQGYEAIDIIYGKRLDTR